VLDKYCESNISSFLFEGAVFLLKFIGCFNQPIDQLDTNLVLDCQSFQNSWQSGIAMEPLFSADPLYYYHHLACVCVLGALFGEHIF
jgi:hypothetical protein